jgi:regulator of protease activity HflC (stomatin/prohibitin superfamily)
MMDFEERNARAKKAVTRTIQGGALAILLGIGALVGMAGLTTINPGEVGILVKMVGSDRGMQDETLDTGWRWVNPITYDVDIYDVRFQQYDMANTTAETFDGQPVVLDLSFEIGLTDSAVPNLHETVGRNWYNEVVYPRARTAVRNATSAQLSENIYTSAGRMAIRDAIEVDLAPLAEMGIILTANVRNLSFANPKYVAKLEAKAAASQEEVIQTRLAEAAIQEAIKVTNIAEGAKQKRIKEAEAAAQEQLLEGQGLRDRKVEEAKGILAIAKAEAEGTRLQVMAYGGGETYASVKWAESIGPKFQVYGVPVGAPGTTTIMDIAGTLSGIGKGLTK